MNFRNKIEHLSLASFSSLVKCLWVKPRAYPRVEHLKVASLGQALALPANIRRNWKSLSGTNVLAYYENSHPKAVHFLLDWPLEVAGLGVYLV